MLQNVISYVTQVKIIESLTILKRTLSELSSFFFELFNRTLVDTTALVDQVTSGG